MPCFRMEIRESPKPRHVLRAWPRMSRGGYRLADQAGHLSQDAH
jgi:hypothetical protein